MIRHLSTALLALSLGACGSMDSMNPIDWLSSEESVVQPAELVELPQSLALRTLWSTSVGAGADDKRIKLVPFVHGGRVYAADGEGEVRAFDSTSGRVIWSRETGLEIAGGPGVGEGLVLLGTSNAELVALEAESGQERWRARVSSEILAVPTIARGVAVAYTIDGKLYGFDAASGERKWIYDRETPVLTLHGSSSPVISGQLVICGFASGRLAAVELDSGALVWDVAVTAPRGRSELERMVDIDSDPLVVNGIVFVTTYQGEMAAVSEETGTVLWRRELSAYAGMGRDNRQLFVSDAEDHLWAIDPRNGSALWRNKKLEGRRITGPAVVGNHVVVGDFEGYLHLLSSEDGRMEGRIRIGDSPMSTPPIVANGVIYAYGCGGELAAITLP
ncbi:MAG: outer membrane protein assembly factor BamB [Candidatus Sedimenticola endophacoides]